MSAGLTVVAVLADLAAERVIRPERAMDQHGLYHPIAREELLFALGAHDSPIGPVFEIDAWLVVAGRAKALLRWARAIVDPSSDAPRAHLVQRAGVLDAYQPGLDALHKALRLLAAEPVVSTGAWS